MCKKKNKREELLSLIPDGAKKILDVGCGKAELSSKLKIQGVEVVGVERDERLYAFAKENLKQVLLGDIEKMQLPFPRSYFDCILYADILEHLSDPLAILKSHRQYLDDNGCIIASIPNIRYYKVIKGLVLEGTWDYVDTGILDRSHLRFFTIVNIQELFTAAGYEIIHIGRNVVASRLLKIINFIFLNSLRNFLTYQYYIVAKKASDASASSFKKRKIEQF
jgi:2-polyprenyl-3-methyl-5-hydroxy-6-metoxy-1,4-benzoquinol methylase